MVLIREETSDQARSEDSPGSSHAEGQQRASTSGGQQQAARMTIMQFLGANGSDALTCALRFATIFFTLGYILPMSSAATQYSCYSKAFVSAAAANAFRLHQRLKGSTNPTFSRAFLQDVMLEDSAHYLLYALLFAFSTPVTMTLLPIVLYAFLQNVNFLLKLAADTGSGQSTVVQKLHDIKVNHTGNILSTIACAEIVIFPVFTLLIFSGKSTILFPFVYYRFLTLRYLSRRNPYTRETFAQLKNAMYRVAGSASCPQLIRSVIYKLIYGVERLAPM